MNHATLYLSLCIALIGCGGSSGGADDCAAGSVGCFCHDPADVAICGAGMTPYCCVDNGGHPMDCGQAVNCIAKPGIDKPGAYGANWCCPTQDGGS